MQDFPRIGFIGGGNMAGALIEGLLQRGYAPSHLHVVDVVEGVRQRWGTQGLSTSETADHHLEDCKIWVLAVKPQQLQQVVQSAKSHLKPDTLVISIAAGISLTSLAQWLGQGNTPWPAVIRAMPNTPALIGQGVTGLACVATTDAAQKNQATDILSCVGQVVWVENDAQIDAVTALSGSGPAYVFRFIEAMVAGGVALGLDAKQARSLATATMSGAAQLAAQSDEAVEVLRERVTSKGGTTAAALDAMQNGGFYDAVIQGVQAAYTRAGQLSEEFGKTHSD